MEGKNSTGDMPSEEFRRIGYRVVDWISNYFDEMENLPVLSQVEPNWLSSELPANAPNDGEDFERVLEDLDRFILPAVTHWNHPNFHGLFSTSTSSVGVLGEMLTAAFDQKAMLWRTSPASTELEEVTLKWLRDLLGFPEDLTGIIYDTASVSSMHAIAAAREQLGLRIREDGMSGRTDLPLLKLYCSEQTHSSIEKSLITLGLGQKSMSAIPTDERFAIDTKQLRQAVEEDIRNGMRPFCVVATVGTTSSTSVDDLNEIGDICQQHGLWLHVDMAYAGPAMILPELRHFIEGIEKADSIVVNPHKWLFTPFDLSVLYVADPGMLKRAFSLVPEYLKVSEDVTNQMDYGIQLGRRFRALKLWFVLRYFGRDGLRSRIRNHISLAKLFASWIEKSERFELAAPVDFALVCFRACHPDTVDLDKLNDSIMEDVNSSGEIYISHTKLDGKLFLRLSVGSIRVEERHLKKAWECINASLDRLTQDAGEFVKK